MPVRVQLRRTLGWRKPAGAVVVSRPGRWGNPFVVDPDGTDGARTREESVARFAAMIEQGIDSYPGVEQIRAELAGRDLACWCPEDGPCHGDVLLEIANR